MTDLVYLSRQEVADLLPPVLEQVDICERTYRAMAAGRVELPPKPAIHPRDDAFIHAMPAYLADVDVASIKWVAGYPANKARGLPYISGLIIVNDAETGFPAAIMDAAEITAARTAAASGVCIRRWAPDGWTRAAIVGCGEQGRYHSRVVAALNPDATIGAYDIHSYRIAELDGKRRRGTDRPGGGGGGRGRHHGRADRRAARSADRQRVARRPLSRAPARLRRLGPGRPDRRRRPVRVGRRRAVQLLPRRGHFRGWPEPHASVGEALDRKRRPKRVACCNLGVGALDAAFAQVVLERARAAGAGTVLPR